MHPGPHLVPTPAPLVSVLLPSGAKVLLLAEGRLHTWRERNQFGPDPQGFFSSTLEPDPTPNRVGWTLSIEEAPAHTCSWLVCFHIYPTSHQGDSCQHTLGEGVTHAHVRSSSPTKATGHTQTAKGCSHTRTPLQDQYT